MNRKQYSFSLHLSVWPATSLLRPDAMSFLSVSSQDRCFHFLLGSMNLETLFYEGMLTLTISF